MDAAEIISRLKFLKNIKAGDKISTDSVRIQPAGWYQGIERSWYGDNKSKTLLFLKKVFNDAFQLQASYEKGQICSPLASRFTKMSIPKQCEIASLLLKDIHEATIGVGFLQETYKHDTKFKCDLATLCENIMIRLKMMPEYSLTPPPSTITSSRLKENKDDVPKVTLGEEKVEPLRRLSPRAERFKRKKSSSKNER